MILLIPRPYLQFFGEPQSVSPVGTKAIMEIYVVPTEVDTATSTTMAN